MTPLLTALSAFAAGFLMGAVAMFWALTSRHA